MWEMTEPPWKTIHHFLSTLLYTYLLTMHFYSYIFSQEKFNICHQNGLYTNVHSSLINNSPKLEMTIIDEGKIRLWFTQIWETTQQWKEYWYTQQCGRFSKPCWRKWFRHERAQGMIPFTWSPRMGYTDPWHRKTRRVGLTVTWCGDIFWGGSNSLHLVWVVVSWVCTTELTELSTEDWSTCIISGHCIIYGHYISLKHCINIYF